MHPLGLPNHRMRLLGGAGVSRPIPAPPVPLTLRTAVRILGAVGNFLGAGLEVSERATGALGGRMHPLGLPNHRVHALGGAGVSSPIPAPTLTPRTAVRILGTLVNMSSVTKACFSY